MSAINLPWSISEGEKGWTEVIDAEGDVVFRVAEWEEGDLQEFYNDDVVKSRKNVDLILELVNDGDYFLSEQECWEKHPPPVKIYWCEECGLAARAEKFEIRKKPYTVTCPECETEKIGNDMWVKYI